MQQKDLYTEYDAFAQFYNKHWGSSFATRIFPVLERLALLHIPTPGPILDLCCGTGQVAQLLGDKGYQVTGVDSSEKMLYYARENAPQAIFVHADARNFILPTRYPCILSLYDSLNHLVSLEELIQVFQCVYASLEKNGYFLFDLNMKQGYQERWKGSFSIIEEKDVCIVQSQYNSEQQLA